MDTVFKQRDVFKFFKQYEADLLAELAKQPVPIAQVSFHWIYDYKYCGRIVILFESVLRPIGEVAYAYVDGSGDIHHHRLARKLRPQHDPVYAQIEHWGAYVRDCFHSAERMKEFWQKAKEELVAAAWHPDRVGKWIEAGVDIEAM
jgi:hypothetical protein